jgi:hypothetical protein
MTSEREQMVQINIPEKYNDLFWSFLDTAIDQVILAFGGDLADDELELIEILIKQVYENPSTDDKV